MVKTVVIRKNYNSYTIIADLVEDVLYTTTKVDGCNFKCDTETRKSLDANAYVILHDVHYESEFGFIFKDEPYTRVVCYKEDWDRFFEYCWKGD